MPDEGGWVKLYRSIFKWEWWDDMCTRNLFVVCLLMANSSDRRWRGISIGRGSFVTSMAHLSKVAGLTARQTRTAVEHLKSTNELTIETTSNYSIITVCHYERYQDPSEAERQTKRQTKRQTADKPPTNERQTTDNKQEYKNGRIEEEIESSSPNVEEDLSGLPPDAAPGEEFDEDDSLQIDYGKLAQYWNEKTKGRFGKILFIENNRRKMVRARIRMYGKRAFMQAIDIVCASEYLEGRTWFNFDWLIRPNNFDKVMSGNFDNREKPNKDGNTTATENNSRLGLGTVTRPSNKGMQTDI